MQAVTSMPSRWLRWAIARAIIVASVLAMVGAVGPLLAPTASAAAGGVVTPSDYAIPLDRDEDARLDASRLVQGLAAVATTALPRSESGVGQSGLWQWPMPGPERVAERFDGPAQPWLPGHRGVDLIGYDGVPVTAVADGVVAYTGTINGVGIISVQHADGLRSTYQPVADGIPRGRSIRAGQQLGYLETRGSHCSPRACLHLGARRGQVYLDPLLLLGAWEVSLLPTTVS